MVQALILDQLLGNQDPPVHLVVAAVENIPHTQQVRLLLILILGLLEFHQILDGVILVVMALHLGISVVAVAVALLQQELLVVLQLVDLVVMVSPYLGFHLLTEHLDLNQVDTLLVVELVELMVVDMEFLELLVRVLQTLQHIQVLLQEVVVDQLQVPTLE